MDLKPLFPAKHNTAIGLVLTSAGPDLPMQIIKSFLPLCAAALVMLPLSGRAAEKPAGAQSPLAGLPPQDEPDYNAPWPDAKPAKAGKALGGKKGQPSPRAAAGVTSAPGVAPSQDEPDYNAPWPDAKPTKKGRKALPDKMGELSAQPAKGVPGASAAVETGDFRRVPMINGIVIVRSLKEFKDDGVPLQPGLTVGNDSLLATPQFGRVADRFLAQPLDEPRMRELQREIIFYYRKHDRPLVDVLYPEQDVSNGMLQIIVIEGRLKEVKVQDKQGNPYTNGWSGLKFLHGSIHLRTNDTIAESRIVKDLDWLKRNPFREVEAVYEPDRREYGLSSLLLRVDEHRQWSADVGYENSGSRVTSEDRITAGVSWGKALGLADNQFRYAFTGDPTLEFLRAHAASYYAPLPWQHGLRLSGVYLDVKGEVDKNTTLEGTSYQLSTRYEVPLPAISNYRQEVSIGLDFKNSDNNLIFGSINTANTPTEIFQIAAGYSSALPDPWGRTSFSLQGYYSPGNVTDLNTDAAFDNSVTFAEANYAYGRFYLERATQLPADFTWIVRGSAQIATGNLLPSEQLGLGGYATVRGYEEREANKDEGLFISNELRTPPFSLLQLFHKSSSLEDQLQFLGFWDYGETSNVKLTPGEDAHIQLSSVGVGLRYSFTRHVSLRFDYGWQLVDTGLKSPDNSRGHIGFVATF